MATKTRNRNRNKTNFVPWLIGLAVVVLIAVPVILRLIERESLPGEFYSSQGNRHIELGGTRFAYNSNPPTSGPHTGDLAAWGSYDYEVPDERLIHNMEDGGVILWYKMGTPEENDAAISQLEDASRGYRRVVIAPRRDLETQYAMTAWQRLDTFDEFDEERIGAFLEAYEGVDHHAGA